MHFKAVPLSASAQLKVGGLAKKMILLLFITIIIYFF